MYRKVVLHCDVTPHYAVTSLRVTLSRDFSPERHPAIRHIHVKTKLRVFERKVLRRIYGPTKVKDGTWRIKSNEELNRLTGNKNIINYIKAQRLAWFGHVHRMPDNSMVKKVYEWSPTLTRSLGRPKNRWEDDIKSDITRMKITNWEDCIRNPIKWKKLVEKAKTSLKL